MPDLGQLPISLRTRAWWTTLGPGVPVLMVHPELESGDRRLPVPALLWMHGRTANKELDPGRFLRLMRAGIGVCSIDLPGHGERSESDLQEAVATLDVVERMVAELDPVTEGAVRAGPFDPARIAIGGFSAGGMAAITRLCRPHSYRAAVLEATTGDWRFQAERAMYEPERVARLNPVQHLDAWREIPVLALHARYDAWVSVEGERSLFAALRGRYRDQTLLELHEFERTGAPYEHIGFGKFSSEAKDRAAAFLTRCLAPEPTQTDAGTS